MNTMQSIIEKFDLASEASLQQALAESIGNNNVTVGSKVAIISDPAFEMDGARGTVKSIEKGYAYVDLGNIVIPCEINLLVPVS